MYPNYEQKLSFTAPKINPTYQQECALYSKSIIDDYDPEFITYLQNSNEKNSAKRWEVDTRGENIPRFCQNQYLGELYLRSELELTKQLEVKGDSDGEYSTVVQNDIFSKIEIENLDTSSNKVIQLILNSNPEFMIFMCEPSPNITIHESPVCRYIKTNTFDKIRIKFDPLMDMRYRFCFHQLIIRISDFGNNKNKNKISIPKITLYLARDRKIDEDNFDMFDFNNSQKTLEFFSRTKVFTKKSKQ